MADHGIGGRDGSALTIAILVTPHFNMSATAAFLDPLRVTNYLDSKPRFRWMLASAEGGPVPSSNGFTVTAEPLSALARPPDIAIVSSSWTPENHGAPPLLAALRRWARFGASLGAIDTGAFVLAEAGLLDGYRATVHYEHMDAFAELHPKVGLVEDLYVFDRDRMTTCGGSAATDMGLQLVRSLLGAARANAAARYIFHERIRPAGERQLPELGEPLGATVPAKLRAAIKLMEQHLEATVPIPEIAATVGLSSRQLERLFAEFICVSPMQYYRDIRLDRARGLVTQTEMPVWEIAVACGFASPEHFSRAYRTRFGLAPRTDRQEGRVPFEFRAWPMPRHVPDAVANDQAEGGSR
ncbi:MAG: GlxA family transcriptional regulator [Pseudomonadota bacterium]